MNDLRETTPQEISEKTYDYSVVLTKIDADTFSGKEKLLEKLAVVSREHEMKMLILLFVDNVRGNEEGLLSALLEKNPSLALMVLGKDLKEASLLSSEEELFRMIHRNSMSLRAYGQIQKWRSAYEPGDLSDASPSVVHAARYTSPPPVNEAPDGMIRPIVFEERAIEKKTRVPEEKKKVEKQLCRKEILKRAKKNLNKKFFLIVTSLVFLISFLPYVLSISSLFLSAARLSTQSKRVQKTGIDDMVSSYAALSLWMNGLYVSIHPIGHLYTNALSISRASTMVAKTAGELVAAKSMLITFIHGIFSDTDFPVSSTSHELVFLYEDCFAQLGFASAELEALSFLKPLVSFAIPPKDIALMRSSVQTSASLFKKAPDLFGETAPITYALLVQDTKKIWPSGGEIKGIALVTFEHGTIKETQVLTIQNKESEGEIAPPAPLKTYLGETNWSIQHANWESSFPDSAERIIWFLDKVYGKETDQKVSGVIAVSDTSLNMITGSDTLGTEAIDALKKYFQSLDGGKWESLQEQFSSKEMLVSVPDQIVQKDIFSSSWTGMLQKPGCEGNCYAEQIPVIETNFGESSERITREADLSVSLEEGIIKRTLTYYIKNQEDHPYKTYIRVSADPSSGFAPLTILSGNEKRQQELEVFAGGVMKEAGVYREIEAGRTEGFVFSWEGPLPVNLKENGSYTFTLRRQPGVLAYPVHMQIDLPNGLLKAVPTPALTKGSTVYYNTVLSRDFESRIFWEK